MSAGESPEPTLSYAANEQQGWAGAVNVMVWALVVFVAIDLAHLGIDLLWTYQQGQPPTWQHRMWAILSGASAIGHSTLLWGLVGCLKWSADSHRIAIVSCKCLMVVMAIYFVWEVWYAIESARMWPTWIGGIVILQAIIQRLSMTIVPVLVWVFLSRPVVREMFTVVDED